MKRLLLLLIGAISIVTSAHAQLAPIDELAAEYEEVAQQLAVYAKLAERATESGTRPEDVDRLEHQVIDIKQRLLVLAARLQAIKADNRPYIRLALGGHDGPRIAQAVGPGESVAASIDIPAKGGSAAWQLHGPNGVPIVGARKEDKNIPAQGSYQARTQLKADHLTQGHYRFVFDYRPEGAEAVHAEAGFKVAGSLIKLKPFTVKARLNQYDGSPIDRPLRSGDILAASADVILAGQPDKPEIGNLVWRLLDSSGAPLPGKEKATQTFEKSGMEPARFRIRLDDLPDGDYRIELVHQLASDPAGAVKAGENFSYRQPVRITRMVASDAPEATQHRSDFRSHEKPYLFAYLSLLPEESGCDVELLLKNSEGDVIQRISGRKARKEGEQRAGMHVESRLAPGRYSFEATLRAGEGNVHSAQTFRVSDYTLAVFGPNAVQSGEYGRFNIQLPNEFVEPVRVDVDGTSGTLIRHADNRLSGSVSGIAEENPETGRVRISVADAEGRIAKGGFEFGIHPIPKSDPVPEPRSYASTPSTYENDEPTPEPVAPKPQKNPYDGFMATINAMNKQQAEIRRLQEDAEKARRAAAQAGRPGSYRAAPVTTPSWMQSQAAAGPQGKRWFIKTFTYDKWVEGRTTDYRTSCKEIVSMSLPSPGGEKCRRVRDEFNACLSGSGQVRDSAGVVIRFYRQLLISGSGSCGNSPGATGEFAYGNGVGFVDFR